MSLLAGLWRGSASLMPPLLRWHLRRRARRGKELATRLPEREGFGALRPPGPLFWLHAASVGETLALLPLLEAMAERAPNLTLLLTTGTLTSAELLERRLPATLHGRVLHRFVPLDVPGWCARFLAGWRPDAAGFMESELWPNLLAAARAQGVPLALVNGRMSANSARRWRWAPGLARRVIGGFTLVMARGEVDAAHFRALGAQTVQVPGNIKDAAPPLPAEPATLARLRATLAGRPVWLASSTHAGEETMVLAAHQAMAASLPGLLTIIVPRHPPRGTEVAAEARALGLATAQRSRQEALDATTQVYVADTLGELGLFYRLAPVAFIGGSLVPHGGQNPMEPARLHCCMVLGPHTGNFLEAVARLQAAGGALLVTDAATLAATVADVLTNPARGEIVAKAAAAVFPPQSGLPGQVADALLELLPGPGPG